MSTISVRVTMLILATVMFAAVWSNDHKPEPIKLRTVVSYDFPSVCPEHVIEPVSHEVFQAYPQLETAADENSLVVASQTVSQEEFLTVKHGPELMHIPFEKIGAEDFTPLVADKPASIRVSELEYPLPSNLTVGEYRIVDRFGNVETLSVTQSALISWGMMVDNTARNAYEVCAGEDRWHFIRIDEPATPTQAEVAEAWKSVFRLADRKVSPAIEKASAPMARWFGGELTLTGETRELR
jgi:hypothetical protein